MKPLIDFIIKIIAFILLLPVITFSMLIALLFWDSKYSDLCGLFYDYTFGKDIDIEINIKTK